MFGWFKKKPPALQSIPAEFGSFAIATASTNSKPLVITAQQDRSIIGHPELPRRFGIALLHSKAAGGPDMMNPAYNRIEDRLLEHLAGPPRVGLCVLKLRDDEMIEWVSYVSEEPQARRIADALNREFPDMHLTAMSEDDPRWMVFKQYRPGK